MTDQDTLGNISVGVTADSTALSDGFDTAVNIVRSGAERMGGALKTVQDSAEQLGLEFTKTDESINRVRWGEGAQMAFDFGESIDNVTKVVERSGMSFKDFSAKFDELADKLKELSSGLKSAGKDFTEFATVPLTALAAAIIKAGNDFDTASDTIRARTGAIGKDLEGLNLVMDHLATNLPNKLGDITSAIVILHDRLGLVGPDLEALSTQILNLSRITGESLTPLVEGAAKAFKQWTINTVDQEAALNLLRNASTNTGASISTILGYLKQFGPALQEMGFSFEQATALISKLDQEGVNVSATLSGLRQALLRLGKAGVEDPVQGLSMIIDRIKEAGSAGEANAIGLKVFGKGATDMVAAIRDGKLSIDDFVNSLRGSTDTIKKAADDTLSFADRLKQLGNQVEVALRPMGESFLAILEKLMDNLKPVIELIGSMAKGFADLDPTLQAAVIGFAALTAAIGPALFIAGQFAGAIANLAPLLSRLPVLFSALSRGVALVVDGFAAAETAIIRYAASMELSNSTWNAIGWGVRAGEVMALADAFIKLYNAYVSWQDAQAASARAGKTLDDALQKLHDHLRDIIPATSDLRRDLSELQDDFYTGRLAPEKYGQELRNIEQQLQKMKGATDSAGNSLTAHSGVQQKTAQTTADLTNALNLLINGVDQSGKAADKAAKDWKAFVDEEFKLAPKFGSLADDMGAGTKAMVEAYNAGMAQFKQSMAETMKAVKGFQEFMSGGWDTMTDKLNTAMVKLSQSFKLPSFTFNFDALTNSLDVLQRKVEKTNDPMNNLITSFMKMNEIGATPLILSVSQLNFAVDTLGVTIEEKANAAIRKAQTALEDLMKAAKDTALQVNGISFVGFNNQLQGIIAYTQTIVDQLRRSGQAVDDFLIISLAHMKENLQKLTLDLEQAFNVLGQRSVDQLKTSADLMEAAFKKIRDSAVTSYNDTLTAFVAAENAKVKAAQMAGEEISVKELAAVELAKMKLEDLAMSWQKTVISMVDGVSKAFGTVFKEFTDQLLQGKIDAVKLLEDLGKAIVNVFTDIAAKAVERFVKESILGILDDGFLAAATKAKVMGTATTAATSEMQAGIASVTASMTELNSQLGEAVANMQALGAAAKADLGAGPTDEAEKAASGGSGGVLGAAGSVGSIVSAISGIIGNFQMSHMNKLLGEIEVTTRKMFNTEVGIGEAIVHMEQSIVPTLGDVANYIVTAIGEVTRIVTEVADSFAVANSALTKVAAQLEALVNKAPSALTGGFTINIDAIAFSAPLVTSIGALSAMTFQQFQIVEKQLDQMIAATHGASSSLADGLNTLGRNSDVANSSTLLSSSSSLMNSQTNTINVYGGQADATEIANKVVNEITRRARS